MHGIPNGMHEYSNEVDGGLCLCAALIIPAQIIESLQGTSSKM